MCSCQLCSLRLTEAKLCFAMTAQFKHWFTQKHLTTDNSHNSSTSQESNTLLSDPRPHTNNKTQGEASKVTTHHQSLPSQQCQEQKRAMLQCNNSCTLSPCLCPCCLHWCLCYVKCCHKFRCVYLKCTGDAIGWLCSGGVAPTPGVPTMDSSI